MNKVVKVFEPAKDRAICKNLCSIAEPGLENECKLLCVELLSEFGFLDGICPYEELCPKGCPCEYYHCTITKLPQLQAARTYAPGHMLDLGIQGKGFLLISYNAKSVQFQTQ